MMIKLRATETNLYIILALLIALALVGPLLVLWALNSLFALALEYSLTNWAAVVIIHAFLNTAIKTK
jgi:hypothetical protein